MIERFMFLIHNCNLSFEISEHAWNGRGKPLTIAIAYMTCNVNILHHILKTIENRVFAPNIRNSNVV